MPIDIGHIEKSLLESSIIFESVSEFWNQKFVTASLRQWFSMLTADHLREIKNALAQPPGQLNQSLRGWDPSNFLKTFPTGF